MNLFLQSGRMRVSASRHIIVHIRSRTGQVCNIANAIVSENAMTFDVAQILSGQLSHLKSWRIIDRLVNHISLILQSKTPRQSQGAGRIVQPRMSCMHPKVISNRIITGTFQQHPHSHHPLFRSSSITTPLRMQMTQPSLPQTGYEQS